MSKQIPVQRIVAPAGLAQPYDFDFSAWPLFRAFPAEQIVSAALDTVTPAGLTVTPIGVGSRRAQYLVSGGTVGVVYSLRCVVTTTSGYLLPMEGEYEVAD